MPAAARTRPDPDCPDVVQHFCKRCAAWMPESAFYSSCVKKGFWFCKPCCIRGESERRRLRLQASETGEQPPLKKRAPRRCPLTTEALTLQLLLAGNEVVLEGRVIRLAAPVPAPAGAVVMAA